MSDTTLDWGSLEGGSLDNFSDPASYYDPTSISTVNPNPAVSSVGSSSGSSGVAWSGLLQSVGQYGTAIASIVSGNPVAVNAQTGQPIGAAGSYAIQPTSGTTLFGSSSGLILLLIVGAVLFLVLKEE